MRKHGKHGRVQLSTTTAAAVTPVAAISQWSLDVTHTRSDDTKWGATQKLSVIGLADITGQVAGFWNASDPRVVRSAFLALPVWIVLEPDSTDVAEPTFTYPVLLNASLSVSATGAVAYTGSFCLRRLEPPLTPTLVAPATDASTRGPFTLRWSSTGAITYDVLFGTASQPVTVVSTGQTGTSYVPTVTAGTTYYWRIIAHNNDGDTTGPIWSFTALAPATPSGPSPVDLGISTLTPSLSWAAADGAMSYDVKFGTVNPPVTTVSSGQTGLTYTPSTLSDGVTYYWRIIANNAAGSTTGPVWSFVAFAEDTVTVLTSTSTGNLDNFNAGALTAQTVLRMNNATLATIRGLTNNGATPTDGQAVWIESVGAGQVDLANQDTNSTAANRLINNVTATLSLAAGSGRALIVYDGTTQRWRLLEHEQGAKIDVAFNAADYTGSGSITWTVASGDVVQNSFYIKGRRLTMEFEIGTSTVAGTGGILQIKVPNGYSGAMKATNPCHYFENSTFGIGYTRMNPASSATNIQISKPDLANWAASTDATTVRGTITFDLT